MQIANCHFVFLKDFWVLYFREKDRGNRRNAARAIRKRARGKEEIRTIDRREQRNPVFKKKETKLGNLPFKITVQYSSGNIR